MDINTTSDLGFFCECSGHSGGRSERFDTCGKPTSLGVFMCEECRLGKPLCWDSTCPTATFYPHKRTSVCEEHASVGR